MEKDETRVENHYDVTLQIQIAILLLNYFDNNAIFKSDTLVCLWHSWKIKTAHPLNMKTVAV